MKNKYDLLKIFKNFSNELNLNIKENINKSILTLFRNISNYVLHLLRIVKIYESLSNIFLMISKL